MKSILTLVLASVMVLCLTAAAWAAHPSRVKVKVWQPEVVVVTPRILVKAPVVVKPRLVRHPAGYRWSPRLHCWVPDRPFRPEPGHWRSRP